MKRFVWSMLTLAMVGGLVITAFAGDEKKAPPAMDPAAQQAMMQAMAPGVHHEHMKKLAGNFDYTIKMWMDPSAPPVESTGKRSAEFLLGGRYLQEKITGTFMGMPFEGMSLMAYDNLAKEYVMTWIDNMGTGIVVYHGQCDGKGTTWTMSGETIDPATGKKVTMTSVTKVVDDNTVTMEMSGPGPDGKDMKMLELTMKRSAM
jgi:Protein of unknown function (DUF1579)